MNISLDNYLVNGQMARNKVRVKGIEMLSPPGPYPLADLDPPPRIWTP